MSQRVAQRPPTESAIARFIRYVEIDTQSADDADAVHTWTWELPGLGAITAPTAVLVRPDGYVAWVGDGNRDGLAEALTTWFGPNE